MADSPDALRCLRDWLAASGVRENARLPPERALCRELGLSRSGLRGALAVLEAEGRIWRHVGRGTFYGTRPPAQEKGVALLARRTHPDEVMEVRLVLEPQIAALAARRATLEDLQAIERCLKKSSLATDFNTFELWDSALHQAIAVAAHNTLLLGLFEAINSIRERRIWGQLKTASLTPTRLRGYHEQHATLVAAIADRDPIAAELAMRAHLKAVQSNMSEPARGQPRASDAREAAR